MPRRELKKKEDLENFLGEQAEAINDLQTDVPSLKDDLRALQSKINSMWVAQKSGLTGGGNGDTGKSLWSDGDAAEMGRYVKAMAQSDSKVLHDIREKSRELRGKSALGTTPLRGDDATQGGDDLLPEQFKPEILRIAEQASALRNLVSVVKMTTRTTKIPKEDTGWSWTWVANETAARTEVGVKIDKLDLTAKTAAGWFSISEELLEDSPVALGRWFAQTCGETWGIELDRLLIDGDVSGASDPFDGILFKSGVNEYIADGKVTIGDLAVDDFYNTVKLLTSRAKRLGAHWMLAPLIWDEICKIVDANGRPLIVESFAGPTPMRIAGYPVLLSEGAPEVAAASTPLISFGSPKRLVMGDRIDLELAVYKETLDRVQYGLIYFTARIRCALEVGLPAAFARLVMGAS